MFTYSYNKNNVNGDLLYIQIKNNINITSVIQGLNFSGSNLNILFDAELTTDEQTTLQTIVDNHQGGTETLRKENYPEKQYTTGKLMADVWWETYANDTYSDKAREIIYEWSGNRLISETEKRYCTDGNLYSESKWTYYTNGNNVSKRQNY